MCPTPLGRIHTRVASLVLPALLGLILSLVTGRPDWIVLIGVLLLLGVALDSALYSWAVKWQPPWMTGVLALFELALLIVLANVLELDLTILEGIVFYWASWLLVVFTRIVLLPTFSLTYVESAGEFRRVAWSIPPSQQSLPVLAAVGGTDAAPGPVLREASGVQELERQPGLSGVHVAPNVATPRPGPGGRQ